MPVWTIEVTTTPKRVLTKNKNRLVYVILNSSSVNVYVGFDSSVSTTGEKKGIPVLANGGIWSDEYHKGEVWIIAESDTEVQVVEVVKEEQP